MSSYSGPGALPPTVVASGTQAATLTTEHSLATVTTPGRYVLVVDTNALANGEELRLRSKTKVLSGSTARVYREVAMAHAQVEPNWESEPVTVAFSCEFTLTQSGGSGRSYDWAVVKLG